QNERGQEQTGDDERTAGAERRDERRGHDRAEADGQQQQALEDAEHAGQDGVGRRTLEEGHPGNISERVADTDDAEQQQREPFAAERRHERERDAEENDTDAEIGRKLPPSNE